VIIAITCVVAIVVIVFVLGVRPKDLPEPEPVSPFAHLDERKAAIYDNLRDLQFEFRVGKLSEADYQQTKQDLQKELAGVMAEIDRLREELKIGPAVPAAPSVPKAKATAKPQPRDPFTCPHCNAHFDQELKFCGECGKLMKAVSV
jgi:hypothetical protein